MNLWKNQIKNENKPKPKTKTKNNEAKEGLAMGTSSSSVQL
jgi:hypothetical protein